MNQSSTVVNYSMALKNYNQNLYDTMKKPVCSDLRCLEEDETRLAAIHAALIEGEDSGVIEDFNPEEFLQKLNAEYSV